ncbi:MAG TPA: hypothetical protein VNB23_11335 [Ramlibacter sp.]|nr:hypothetical protein [Ramlibacter sp.]
MRFLPVLVALCPVFAVLVWVLAPALPPREAFDDLRLTCSPPVRLGGVAIR